MNNKDNRLIIILLFVFGIVFTIVGSTFAYFTASANATGNRISGSSYTFDMNLNITSVRTGDLVPTADNLISQSLSGNNKCIDQRNYGLCSLYKLRFTNNSGTETLVGYLQTINTTYTTSNLRYRLYDSNYTPVSDIRTVSITPNDTNYFMSGSNSVDLTIPANGTKDYYLVIWIHDVGENQLEDQNKLYSGRIVFTAKNGDRITSDFSTGDSIKVTIDPNGGIYNGSTQKYNLVKVYNSYYGLQTPTRDGYTFNDWTLIGSGTLLRGNANGDGTSTTSNGINLTETIIQDDDGSQYTNYKYTDASVTSNTWPALKYPNYSYILGHTYRISLDIRLNVYKNLAYLDVRHAFKDNDYYTGNGLVYTRIPATAVGQGWIRYTMDRTWDTSKRTVVVSGTTHEFDVNPLLEIYTAINANNTGSVDFDIKNIIIEDITNNTQITTGSFNGYIYKFGNSNATLKANWVVNQ